jgi:hypothetical protein
MLTAALILEIYKRKEFGAQHIYIYKKKAFILEASVLSNEHTYPEYGH